MDKHVKAFKAAFPHTLPVLAGFLFLGVAYGVLMSANGFSVGWTVLISLLVFAGSMQYVAIPLLLGPFQPLQLLLLTLMVNARHMFYGLSMLEPVRQAGKYKWYLIFGMCDETFSIICSTKPPEGVFRERFMFWVTLLNHSYWVLAGGLGALVGRIIPFNTALTNRLGFVLTALFTVIFVNQWKQSPRHAPALVGIGCSAFCLLAFGPEHFILPAMGAIVAMLLLLKRLPAYQTIHKGELS